MEGITIVMKKRVPPQGTGSNLKRFLLTPTTVMRGFLDKNQEGDKEAGTGQRRSV